MKALPNTIEFLCIANILLIALNAFGQVPPNRQILCPMNLEILNEDIFNYREYFTIFNYTKVSDSLEYKYRNFDYKSYKSFTAPKGIKKLTFFYYSTIQNASFTPTKFEFFYNEKTHLLEREIVYSTNSNTLEIEKTDEYTYHHYKEGENEIIKKSPTNMAKRQDSIVYVYSENKEKLIKRIETAYPTREIEYVFSNDNILVDIIVNGENKTFEPEKSSEYILAKNLYPINFPWMNKDYWIDNFDMKIEVLENIDFPELENLKINTTFLELQSNNYLQYKKVWYRTSQYKTSTSIYESANLSQSDKNKFDPNTICYYYEKNFALFDKEKNIGLAFLFYTNRNQVYSINIAKDSKRKNTYTFKYITDKRAYTEIVDLPQYLRNLNSLENLAYQKYTIKTKAVKGLNEVYLVKDDITYPLVIIN